MIDSNNEILLNKFLILIAGLEKGLSNNNRIIERITVTGVTGCN